VGEAAARVLVGTTGRLRDSVEAHELVHDHLTHLDPLRSSIVLPSQTGRRRSSNRSYAADVFSSTFFVLAALLVDALMTTDCRAV